MKRSGVFCLLALLWSFDACSYDLDNTFGIDQFKRAPSDAVFSIPIDKDSLAVVYPVGVGAKIAAMDARFSRLVGVQVPWVDADTVTGADIAGRHLILLGSFENNRLIEDLYRRRRAFTDAAFPGPGGYSVYPAEAVHEKGNYIIIVGASDLDGVPVAFDAFLGAITQGSTALGPERVLSTAHAFPKPRESVDAYFEPIRRDMERGRLNYGLAPVWGMYYHLTGDTRWAAHFRDCMYFMYERAKITGRWIPEPWTNVYFLYWKLALVWNLLDTDPVFTTQDREVFDEVLWGYFTFIRGETFPFFDERWCRPGEPRQNHATFMALSLLMGYDYFTENYGVTGLDDIPAAIERCFSGQRASSRPNDDAGGYLNYSVSHMLTADLFTGNEDYLTAETLRRAATLMAVSIDNRGDPAAFGDRGYTHRRPGGTRGLEGKFFSMAAWYYSDPMFKWISDWYSSETHIGMESIFAGDYDSSVESSYPEKFCGITPVFLDDAALSWVAGRIETSSHAPNVGAEYIDKLSFRRSFDPNDEYMLIDGVSAFAHGHLDGNTVACLTWRDRRWIVDGDYINMTPRYHNGVTIVRDGVQTDPPPLTALDIRADDEAFGISATSSTDYNGIDWQRTVVWKKGDWFFVIDDLVARKRGDYSMTSRWRIAGNVEVRDSSLESVQDGKRFLVSPGDAVSRVCEAEPDAAVYLGTITAEMSAGDSQQFAVLMTAPEVETDVWNVHTLAPGLWRIEDDRKYQYFVANNSSFFGLNSDAKVTILDGNAIRLCGFTRLIAGAVNVNASAPVTLSISEDKMHGVLTVNGDSGVEIRAENWSIDGDASDRQTLAPGLYQVVFSRALTVTTPNEVLSTESDRHGQDFKFANFCISEIASYTFQRKLTAWCDFERNTYLGFQDGMIGVLTDTGMKILGSVGTDDAVTAIHAFDKKGRPALIAGDASERIHYMDKDGTLRWTRQLSPYFGGDANATHISTIRGTDGSPLVLTATNGWKLYAHALDGTQIWESFIFYHPLTMTAPVTTPRGTVIAVGTSYHTPINVVDTRDGSRLWFTWEQVGDEFLSTTDYCGYHCTTLAICDADGDGDDDIVFGTRSNCVYALDSLTGETLWRVQVDDEVTSLTNAGNNGTTFLVCTTRGGSVVLIGKNGAVIKRETARAGILSCAVVKYASHSRFDIAVGCTDGSILVYDDDLVLRGVFNSGASPVVALSVDDDDGLCTITALTAGEALILQYIPRLLRPSRQF